jgi:hypothetical protein
MAEVNPIQFATFLHLLRWMTAMTASVIAFSSSLLAIMGLTKFRSLQFVTSLSTSLSREDDVKELEEVAADAVADADENKREEGDDGTSSMIGILGQSDVYSNLECRTSRKINGVRIQTSAGNLIDRTILSARKVDLEKLKWVPIQTSTGNLFDRTFLPTEKSNISLFIFFFFFRHFQNVTFRLLLHMNIDFFDAFFPPEEPFWCVNGFKVCCIGVSQNVKVAIKFKFWRQHDDWHSRRHHKRLND